LNMMVRSIRHVRSLKITVDVVRLITCHHVIFLNFPNPIIFIFVSEQETSHRTTSLAIGSPPYHQDLSPYIPSPSLTVPAIIHRKDANRGIACRLAAVEIPAPKTSF
jgi:hypothetical protein